MGDYISVYRADIDQLKRTYGSKDPALYAVIIEKFAGEIHEDESSVERESKYADQDWFDDSILMRDALKNIIFRNVDIDQFASNEHQYIWAFEKLLETLGEQIAPTNMTYKNFSIREVERLLNRLGSPSSVLKKSFFDWPPFSDEFGFLNVSEVKGVLSRIRPLNLMGFETGAARMAIDIQSWFQCAESANQGLIFFYP